MSGLKRVSNTTSVDNICEILERDGGIIIEDMVSRKTLDAFFADIQPFLDRVQFSADGFSGARTRRVSALFAKSLHTAEMLTQQQFIETAERSLAHPFPMMSGEARVMVKPTIQVCCTQAIDIWPGQKAQDLHRDDGMFHVHHPSTQQTLLQTLFAGTDFTAENGGTLVIPGSHKWDMDRRPRLEEAIPTEMKRGSGLMYFGSCYHGGGANTTENQRRVAIAISFTQGYRRQEENQYLVVPRDTVKKYSQQVQELLGYKMCTPYCGWVEMNEPSIVLRDEDFSIAAAASPYDESILADGKRAAGTA
ncbi:Phytanoyl-CoA dioxygenase (PhyH) [compost metagenome]